MIIDLQDIFLSNDQPFTCPHCGARTIIIFDSIDDALQIHVCRCCCNDQFIVDCSDSLLS